MMDNPFKINAPDELEGAVSSNQDSQFELVDSVTVAIRQSHSSVKAPDLGERYEFLDLLGSGGTGTVYKVRDSMTGAEVALKVLKSDLHRDTAALKRFDQECSSLAQLTHPNIVAIFDHGVTPGGEPFLVMELAEGETLSSFLQREGALKPSQAIELFEQLCDALSHAHENGVVHRDLKPNNIMVSQSNDATCVKIVDFGLARMMESASGKTTNITQAGDLFGTPQYMSPEQCQGKGFDHRSDVYSLGCIMYETLTGAPLFKAEQPIQMAVKHVSKKPARFPGEIVKNERMQELETITRRCLEKIPANRYQSMRELSSDLSKVSSGAKISSTNKLKHSTTNWVHALSGGKPFHEFHKSKFGQACEIAFLLLYLSSWYLIVPLCSGLDFQPLAKDLLPFHVFVWANLFGLVAIPFLTYQRFQILRGPEPKQLQLDFFISSICLSGMVLSGVPLFALQLVNVDLTAGPF
ncbi:MAG: serine/threonine protein kinase, partial [Cyanobacteria bacterium]|nr:serine/threonine protein kinase [Cyanobacteriota bacterium]